MIIIILPKKRTLYCSIAICASLSAVSLRYEVVACDVVSHVSVVLCAANVHSMLCCDDNLSLKETFVTSSTCQHLVTLLQSLAVSCDL